MSDKVIKITCEQFNVNDDSYKITDVLVTPGQKMKKGDLVMILDSSKASYDIHTDNEGFLYTPFTNGVFVGVNETMFIILEEYSSEKEAEYKQYFSKPAASSNAASTDSSEKNITHKAKLLMEKHGISADELGNVDTITEKTVQDFLSNKGVHSGIPALELAGAHYHVRKRLAVIGAGQAFIQMLDMIASNNYVCTAVYDDNAAFHGKFIYGHEIKGKTDPQQIKKDHSAGLFDEIIISIGSSTKVRKMIYDKLQPLNIPFANLIHPTAHIGHHCIIGGGNVILPFVHIGPCARIGDNNLISAHCNIEHHNALGSHCTFGPGVMMSGTVSIGDQVKFGTGIFVEPGVKIGNGAIVSSGCIIMKHIPENSIAYMKAGELKFKETAQ